MKNLLITSINPGVGKSTFTLALAMKLKETGMNVGYFKPITDSAKDTDASDAKNLLGMKEGIEIVNPMQISAFEYDMKPEQISESKDRISKAFDTLTKNYELLLIEGCRKVNYLSFLGLSAKELAVICNAKILLVSSGEEIEDTDRLILGKEYLGDLFIGGVFTLVPDQIIQHFESFIIPQLRKQKNIDVFGLIPSRTHLVAPTVMEIQSALNAQVLAGKDHMDKLVEDFTVGAMEPDSALKYFRKSINKAVITGGDRPRIALAAMETDTSVVILTGSILPPVGVLARAEERGIPVLLVNSDTFQTVKQITQFHVYGKLRLEQKDKIMAWSQLFETVNYQGILNCLK